MEVYWLEQTEADLPERDEWLSPTETARLSAMRFVKRRYDWRLGRWTAKNALALYWKVPADPQVLASIEIRPAPSGAPEVFFQNKPAAARISLSHRAGIAACAVTRSSGMLGCDLEVIEPRSDAFLTDYFTAEEQSFVAGASARDRSRFLALLWSAKESALKALRMGLRLDTRSVMVGLFGMLRGESEDAKGCAEDRARFVRSSNGLDGWRPLEVRRGESQVFNGWWQATHDLMRTVVALPSPEPPVLLTKAACLN
jgi:4'-phosphopantetheinyl transferase